MKRIAKLTPLVLLLSLHSCPTGPSEAAAAASGSLPESAWDVLVRTEPLDTLQSFTALERRVLDVLDLAAAERFLAGADPASVELLGGGDLASFLSNLTAGSDEELTFVPVEPCRIADTRLALGKLGDNETRHYVVRGATTDYSPQGGNPNGCGIPGLDEALTLRNVARAVLFDFKVVEPDGDGELRGWPSNYPRPAIPLAGYSALLSRSPGIDNPAVVPLCDELGVDPCLFGDIRAGVTRAAHLVIEVHGYFVADEGEIPAGAIVMWSGALADVPEGWVLCDGTNGTPDLRDRFVLGAGPGEEPGAVGGAHSYALSEDQLAPHGHVLSINAAGQHTHTLLRPRRLDVEGPLINIFAFGPWSLYEIESAGTSAAGNHSHSGSALSTGAGAPIDNRPAFYELAFIMKL